MPKSNIYTRTGDSGLTSLVGGSRIAKDSVRLDAYGTIDELSSFIGMIVADKACNDEVKGQLIDIQNMMLNLGGYLATPVEPGTRPEAKVIGTQHLTDLEGWIDALDEQIPPIRAFILPGGSEIAAKTHAARTVCRRAERRLITLSNEEYVDPIVIAYINRLSDYLFILARYFNFIGGVDEIIWKK